MANNETIKILNGDKIVVNVNTFRHFINELINRRIKGKGLSTNDFSDELKSKLTKTISIYNSKDLEVENSSIKLKLGDIIYYEANEYIPYPTYTYVADITSENEVTFGNILTNETLGVYLESLSEILNTKVDKVEGKGLSTNDFTNEDKTKLNSALTSTSIISAGKVSGDLSNSKINLNNIFTERYPGDTRVYGTIPGANVSGTLTNAIMEGSKVSGELTNVTINAGKIIDYDNSGRLVTGIISGTRIQGNIEYATIHANKIGDTIDGTYVLGAIDGSRLRKNISNATIGGSQVKGKLYYATIDGSNVSGHLSNATIGGSQVSGHLSNATIDSSNIKGTITAEQILADGSITSTHLATGAVLPENIASGNLASGVKVNVNSLVGNISAGRLQGNIDKERMRSGFLELCEEYKVVRNNSVS